MLWVHGGQSKSKQLTKINEIMDVNELFRRWLTGWVRSVGTGQWLGVLSPKCHGRQRRSSSKKVKSISRPFHQHHRFVWDNFCTFVMLNSAFILVRPEIKPYCCGIIAERNRWALLSGPFRFSQPLYCNALTVNHYRGSLCNWRMLLFISSLFRFVSIFTFAH